MKNVIYNRSQKGISRFNQEHTSRAQRKADELKFLFVSLPFLDCTADWDDEIMYFYIWLLTLRSIN